MGTGSAQIAACRIMASAVMNCKMSIMRVTLTDDGYGSKVDARMAVYVDVPCRVQEVIRTPNTQSSNAVKEERANHIVKVPWGTDVLPSDHFHVVDDFGRTSIFEVDSPYNNTQDGGSSSYYCFKKS